MAMGRPKKPDSDRMDSELRIRLTAEDRQTLDDAAKKAGQETSTWARDALLSLAQKKVKKQK
jgi:hypothetical protein